MPIGIVQSVVGTGLENPTGVVHPTVSFGTVTAGHTIIVANASRLGVAQTAPTDNAGNTYRLACAASDLNVTLEMWYAYNVAGSSSLTVTANDPQGCVCGPQTARGIVAGYEVSGLTVTDPLDRTATIFTPSGASPSATTPATAQADELVVACLGGLSVGTPSVAAGTGFANLITGTFAETDGAKLIVSMETRIVSAMGTQTGAFVLANFDRSGLGVATFKAAPAGSPAPPIPPLVACQAVARAALR